MTDKELLELAAKSIGLKYRPENNYVVVDAKTGQWLGSWNPLTDDGDALRLAVKLKMQVKQWESNSIAVVVWDKHATEDATNDRYAATRRAIVRAAAEIGKAK
jgi:hypothetical protein